MTMLVYLGAALAGIAGCIAFRAWLRLDRSAFWVPPGMVSPACFAFLLTRVDSASAGRAYAAYGGIYIPTSMSWMGMVEQRYPDRWDLADTALCVAGALLILFGPRTT